MKKINLLIQFFLFITISNSQIPIPDFIIESNQANAYMGWSVSNAGDVNNDGYDDVIVGANNYDDGQTDEGAVFIYYGSASGINPLTYTKIGSNQTSAFFGISVSGAGDINGDGFDDVIVGAYLYDNGQTDEGRAYIFNGSASGINVTPSATLESNQAMAYFGHSVSDAGDVNGDGFDDVIVGSYRYDNGQTDEGRAFIYHGSSSGIITTPAATMEGDQNFAYFGDYISTAGDVNNDGFDDIIIAAKNFSNDQPNEGRVYIFEGSTFGINTIPISTVESNQTNSNFGRNVSSAGDVNGDGFDDVIVGAYQYDNGQTDEGRVYIYRGTPDGIDTIPSVILESDNEFSNFGNSVAGGQDINNDGYDDILIGAYWYTDDFTAEGHAFTYYGSETGINPAAEDTFDVDQNVALFGSSVDFAGDVNNDGAIDLLIGAFHYDDGQTDEGAAFVYYGVACTPSPELCNILDDNCNGLIDDGVVETISISAAGPTTFCQGGSVVLSAIYSGATVQWKKDGVNIAGATSANYTVTKKGNYTCVTTSPCGSATSSIINVIVNKNPNASISAGGATTFCAGGSVTLTEVPSGGCTYQWYKGASAIAGATSTNYIATTTGNYKCRVTKTATGCYKNSNAIAVSVPCRESNTPLGGEGGLFTIYPNPANDKLNVQINSQLLSPFSFLLIITDLQGREIYSSKLNSPKTEINISDFASGMYFVKINFDEVDSVQKFIKQ